MSQTTKAQDISTAPISISGFFLVATCIKARNMSNPLDEYMLLYLLGAGEGWGCAGAGDKSVILLWLIKDSSLDLSLAIGGLDGGV
jgi:hypothetical protein